MGECWSIEINLLKTIGMFNTYKIPLKKGICMSKEEIKRMKGGLIVGNNPQAISLLYIVGLFALLYFLMIRPQQQRQKKHNEMIGNIKQDDKVITIGGIYGTIVKIKERSFILEVADKVRMEFLKTAVSQIVTRQEDEEDQGEQ